MGKGQTRQSRKPESVGSIYCSRERALACGAWNGKGKKCSLAKIGEAVTVFERDGGDGRTMKGKVIAVVSAQGCDYRAIEAYVPVSARPTYRLAPNVLKPVFRS